MSRSQIDNSHDRLAGQNGKCAKVAIVGHDDAVFQNGAPQQIDISCAQHPLFSHVKHVEATVAQEPDDVTMNVLVGQQFEPIELQGLISTVTRTSFFTAWAA